MICWYHQKDCLKLSFPETSVTKTCLILGILCLQPISVFASSKTGIPMTYILISIICKHPFNFNLMVFKYIWCPLFELKWWERRIMQGIFFSKWDVSLGNSRPLKWNFFSTPPPKPLPTRMLLREFTILMNEWRLSVSQLCVQFCCMMK